MTTRSDQTDICEQAFEKMTGFASGSRAYTLTCSNGSGTSDDRR